MDLDLKILRVMRSPVGKSPALDALIKFFATWLFYLLLLVAVTSLTEGGPAHFTQTLRIFLTAVAAVIIAEIISWTLGLLLYRERPFTHLKFEPLVWMPPRWKSFPSDHTTIGFTVALTFLLLAHPLGPLFLAMAVLVGLARISAGVHYPSDVLAGALLAGVVSLAVVEAVKIYSLI
ncbi:phosphatase PAP2 family protein [Patescibacteria group bacterium]|nr:MAG: phosphatase PAP2 family protein [Patescibacteria group bacterium]